MPKLIKMLVVLDGKESEVGRCHPGQARLLIKQDLAGWRNGGIVLKGFVNAASLTKDGKKVPSSSGWGAYEPTTFTKEMDPSLVRETVRREMEFYKLTDKDLGIVRTKTTFIRCKTLLEYCEHIMAHRKSVVYVADDPMARTLGFVDMLSSEAFEISLFKLKGYTQEDIAPLGISVDEFKTLIRTAEGRSAIIDPTHQPSYDFSHNLNLDPTPADIPWDDNYLGDKPVKQSEELAVPDIQVERPPTTRPMPVLQAHSMRNRIVRIEDDEIESLFESVTLEDM